jgi:hypothetical protein
MKEDEEEQTPSDPSSRPIDMAVAMEAARGLSPELLGRAAEILTGPLPESQREEALGPLLEEFNRRVNEDYRRKLKDKARGSGRSADA